MNLSLKICTFSSFLLTLLLSLHISVSSSSSDISELFESWCRTHGKTYPSEEERLRRLKVFEDNYEFVSQHNVGNSSYSLSLNAFADLTHHEFKSSRLGLAAASANLIRSSIEEPVLDLEIPSSVDWRKEGAVTNVKDQGSCGEFVLALLSAHL